MEAFAALHGAELIWRPILLGGLFKRIHTPLVPLSVMSRPRREYMARDLMDWAETWNVPFQFNSEFPLNTLLALRVALAVPALTLPLYRAAWADNRDIGQPEVIAQVIREAGMAPEEVLALAGKDGIKDRLRANTEAAEAIGPAACPPYASMTDWCFGGRIVLIWCTAHLRAGCPPLMPKPGSDCRCPTDGDWR